MHVVFIMSLRTVQLTMMLRMQRTLFPSVQRPLCPSFWQGTAPVKCEWQRTLVVIFVLFFADRDHSYRIVDCRRLFSRFPFRQMFQFFCARFISSFLALSKYLAFFLHAEITFTFRPAYGILQELGNQSLVGITYWCVDISRKEGVGGSSFSPNDALMWSWKSVRYLPNYW